LGSEPAQTYANPIEIEPAHILVGSTLGFEQNGQRFPTLFMLVSALMGLDVMQAAYKHAIASEYRFYSYGDGSLLLP
jgi:hypothetical protein